MVDAHNRPLRGVAPEAELYCPGRKYYRPCATPKLCPRRMPAWLDALNDAPPADSYFEAHAILRTLWSRFGDDVEFRAFARAVLRWQTDFAACAEIHAGTDALIRGEKGTADARSLLHAVADAGAAAPALYRGFAEPFHPWEVVSKYAAGSRVDLALVSFTSEFDRALEFAWLTQENDGGTEVVFLLREGAHAVRIELMAPDEIHWREREWLTGGRFVVTAAAHRAEVDRVEVQLTQEGYFDVR